MVGRKWPFRRNQGQREMESKLYPRILHYPSQCENYMVISVSCLLRLSFWDFVLCNLLISLAPYCALFIIKYPTRQVVQPLQFQITTQKARKFCSLLGVCRPVISSVILRVSSSVNSVKFPYGLIYNIEIFYVQYVLDTRIPICTAYTQKCKKVLELYTWTDQCDQHQWALQSLTNDIVVLLPKMSLARIFVHVPALLIGTFSISTISSF